MRVPFRTLATAMVAFSLLVGLSLVMASPAPPDAITADGGHYYGALVNGLRHGQGRVEWSNGDRYEGGFHEGLFAGKGRLESASGQVYEGDFADGHFHGRGRMVDPGGAVYEGEFERGVPSGSGELTYPDGRVYRGAFARGLFNGKGRFENPDGEVYEGDFRDGEFTGTGVYTRPDGTRHAGEFVKWRPQGKGTFTDAAGNVYEGEFKDGDLSGPGRFTGKNGLRYEGGFSQWRFHGRGVLRHPNGDVYEGSFARGMYDGQGTLTYARPQEDGRTQDSGLWRLGRLHDPAEDERMRARVEAALYRQGPLLDQALAGLAAGDPGRIDLYLLAIGGDGSQEVFRREVEFVRNQFDRDFGTAGRSLVLVNSRNTVDTLPMATRTSIARALEAIAGRMDREQDILFLFLTSHGSREHEFTLDQNGMDLRGLPAAELGRLLKESGVRWKVVVVSACYSGGFIDPLKDDHTLIITAARHDRRSFGCADDNDFTYFGRAFFEQALPASASFSEAFRRAEALVQEWEAKDFAEQAEKAAAAAAGGEPQAARRAQATAQEKAKENHSLPQMHNPPAVEAYLRRWRAQLGAKRSAGAEVQAAASAVH